MKQLRTHRRLISGLMILMMTFWQIGQPLRGATFYWDSDATAVGNAVNGTGLGGMGTWNLTTMNWWDEMNDVAWGNALNDVAIFAGAAGEVMMGTDVNAGALLFQTTGYQLTGSTLTLGDVARVDVAAFTNARIDSVIAGGDGLTKTGNGTLFLGNSSNSYTGDTVINGGSLAITHEGQLGASTNTISINGIAQTGNPGYSGGQLVVDGSLGGVTMNRNIAISGRGPGASNASGGLVSVGSNTFNGDINLSGPASGGRITASHGNTTFNGTVQLGNSADSLFYGNGNFIINGQITGFEVFGDRFIKTGNLIGTTLWLTNENNNFLQSLRVDSGFVRVSSIGALGANTGLQAIDINSGNFEVRSDALDWSSKDIRKRGNGAGIVLEHALGSTQVGQSYSFGAIQLDANANFILSGRSGLGLSLTGNANGDTAIDWINGGTGNFQNNSNGLLTIDADIQRRSETIARTFTFTGSGDMRMTGSLLQAGTGAVSLVKDGLGTLTIEGTASDATGVTTVRNGTLEIGGMGSLPSGALRLGNDTTTGGVLRYMGAGESTSRALVLNTTTGSNLLLADGTGALIMNGAITALDGNKTFYLGGANADDNELGSGLPSANATLNLIKIGAGTWVLSAANLHTGTTTISEGTLKLKDTGGTLNVLSDAGAIVFNTDALTQAAGGTLEYLGDGANASTELLGALTITTGANTVRATAGASGTAALTFASLAAPAKGAGVNFVTNAGGSISLTGTTNTNGIIDARLFFNGADFAMNTDVGASDVLGAAIYTDEAAGMILAGGNLTPYHITAMNIAGQTTATINAGIKFSDSRMLTLADANTLTINNGTNTSGAILVSGGTMETPVEVTISGGSGITTGGSGDLVIRTDGEHDTLNLNTAITSTTTGGITKLGSGVLKLGAANANTTGGFVNINEGTVQMQTGSRLGADSVDVNLRQGATLDLNGVNLGTVASGTGSLGTFNGVGNLTNTGAQASIRIGNDNSNSFFTGSITGAIDLVKNGTGTVWLEGPQTYTGVVTISAGNLDVTSLANIGQASGLGTGDATDAATNAASLVFNGGALRYIGQNGGNTYLSTQTPSVSIDRLFTLAGNGTIASFGSYGQKESGTRSANHATLVFNNTGAVAFSGTGARTLTLRGDSIGENYLGLQLIDNPNDAAALAISKTDSSLWILGNAANSYTGTTTIFAGALQAQDGTSLPTASNLFLNGGGGLFQSSGTFTRALGTGAGEVRFLSDGVRNGFSASTAPLTVTLGTPGLVWGSANSPTPGTANFLGAGTFFLSSNSALADVTFTNDFEVTPGIAGAGTATTTAGSSTVTFTGGFTTAGLAVGQLFSHANVPAGVYISSINSATQISLSTGTGVTAGANIASTVSGEGWREIRVDDNGLTGLDFATVSGVISGAGGIGKEGTGLLILGDANTYSGKTVIRDGFLTVTSIGAAGDASSSLGTNVGGGVLEIGRPGSTSTANLLYVGSGEIATREINLVGTTGTRRIDSGGSGALVLTNLLNKTSGSVNTSGGAKTLELRGQNNDGNMVTSVLANNGGALSISKFDGGVWILNPTSANTFTGSITAGGGTLGLTADGIGAASQINFSNGAIFAYGGDLVTSRTVQLNNNTTAVFAGSNNITLNGTFQVQAGNNDQTISNNLEGDAVLTINSNLTNLKAHSRTISVRGYGDTVWNGVIQNATGANTTSLNIAIDNTATFEMAGGSPNTYSGVTTLSNGILKLSKAGALGTGSFSFNGGLLTTTVSGGLTGADAISNTTNIAGSPVQVFGTESIEFSGKVINNNSDRRLDNNLTGDAELILNDVDLSQNSTSRTFTLQGSGNTTINGVVANGSTATGSGLRMNGTGVLNLLGANTAAGTLTVERGTANLAGADGVWNGNLSLSGAGVLNADNSTVENANRLKDTGTVTISGGTLNFIGDADGTSEATGAVTINSLMGTIQMSGGGPNVLTFASANFANSGSSLDLSSITGLGSANQIIFTTEPTANIINGVFNRVMIAGDFATHTANGVEAFTAYNVSNNLNSAANTDTMELTMNAGLATTRTLNALKINGDGLNIGVGSTAGVTLSLSTHSVLNTGGDNTLSIPFLNIGAAGMMQVDAGTTLTVDSTLIGGGQINKTGTGGLVFNTRQFQTSTVNISGGTLTLSGGDYTLFPGGGAAVTLNVGATLELNGATTYMGTLSGPISLPGGAGTLQNSGALATYVTNGGGGFGGSITGNINLGRVGGGTLTLETAQTYTGGTALIGGDTALRDDATLPMTSAPIEINQARLLIQNNSTLQTQVFDRVSDTAPITLRGGTIDVNGRISTPATETMGALTVLEGANTITSSTGGGTITSSTLTFASLTRSAGATINFTGSSALGQNGNLPKILFTEALPTVASGVLGAWAIANSTDYAAYNATNGVGVVGTGGFVGYTPDFASGSVTNLDAAARGGLPVMLAAGTTTTGMLRLGGKSINDIAFASGTDVLNLELGGLLRENNVLSSSIGTTATRGVLTAGGTENSGTRELVIYANTATGSNGATFGGTSTTIGVGTTTVTLNTINGVGLLPGMQINNGNFAPGTTVVSVDNYNVVTLSTPSVNATSQSNQTLTTGIINLGTQSTGSNVVTMNTTVGVTPGMTITGTGIPAGTFVVSVDSSTQLTLSQAATTNISGTASYTLGMGNIIVNSVIADNGHGNSVSVVKSGNGVLNLSAANTYTGGTVVDQGTLNLIGEAGTVVIPAGGLTVTGATVLMNTNEGQIHATNSVTLNGSSTVTLTGNNTLDSIVFNNVGGTSNPTFNVGGTLTLTSATAVTETSKNAATTTRILGGNIILNPGTNTFSVGAPTLFGDVYTDKRVALEISSNIVAPFTTINKTGDGLLELNGQSNFGALNVVAGGIVVGTNSTSTLTNTLVSGPLGAGVVTMTAGTILAVDDSSRTIANAITFNGNPIFSNVGGSTDTLVLNGPLVFDTLATSGLQVNIDTPYLRVVLGGQISGMSAVTSIGSGSGANTINKTGLGIVSGINLTGVSNTATINIDGLTDLNTFELRHDGDGTRSFETIGLGAITWNPANGSNISLTIGKVGGSTFFPTPAWKTLAPSSLNSSVLPNGITLANNDGYGLIIADDIALAAGNNWTVNNANTSLLPAGLELSGVLSGVNGITKSGNGVLRLSNAANAATLVGTIDITNGTVEGASDGVFGDLANILQIGSNSLAEGLRISGSFGTPRTIHLNAASSGIDVTGNNVFTLNSPFTFSAADNALRKNDLGTLVLTQSQAGWDGVFTIGQGVVRITDGAALGSTTGNLILANVGASLQIDGIGGPVTVADAIRIASTNNSSSNGINSSGAIHNLSGTNTLTGAITIDTTTTDSNSRSGTITADMGSVLNVEGGIVLGIGTGGSNRDNWIGFGGQGTINLTTTAISHSGNLVADGHATLTKFGSGTLNIQLADAYTGNRVVVKSGVLSLNGDGTLGIPGTGGGTGDVYLNPTGLLVLDSSGTAVDDRLSGRNINISGADLTIIGNAGMAVSETVGTFTLREGASYITLNADSSAGVNFTTGTITRSAQATLIVRGDNLGDAAGAGVATIAGGNYIFIGQTGGTGSTNKSIVPWAFGDTSLTGEGTFFLTADSAAAGANTGTNILRPLAANEQTNDLATASANVNLTTNESLQTLTPFNSLRLDSGGGVTLEYVPLTLESGGLIALAGNTGISGFSGVSYLTTANNAELNIHTVSDLTLPVPIAATTGSLTKSGPGTLILTAGNAAHGTVMINGGILQLGGGDQTILPGRNMFVNEGGTLDLNGTVQQVNILESRQSAVLARNDAHFGGGTVINSSEAQATLAMATSSSIFAGAITGNIAVTRATAPGATADWNLYVDQTYSGPTLYSGGRVILQDTAALTTTPSIEIANATFLVTASNNATEAANLTDRINDNAAIILDGAMFQFRVRAALATTETLGAVTLKGGSNIIDFAEGGSAINSSTVTLASLARDMGSRTTVRFLNIDASPSDDQQLFISNLNGTPTTNIGDGLVNNIIGGWALFEREFASYTPGQGVGGLNTGGFAGYSPFVDPNLGTATDNVRIVTPNAGSVTTLLGNVTLNSLNMQAGGSSTDDSTLDLGGNTLTLASGGLILAPVATTALNIDLIVQNGSLTAGTSAAAADLYLNAVQWFNGQADNTGNADVRINADIVDNAFGGAVTLVISGNTGRGTLAATNDVIFTGNNTHTGGTFIQSGQVRLNNSSANGSTILAVPGDLTISGGYSSNAGIYTDRVTTVIWGGSEQMANTGNLTVRGGGIVNLNNFNQTVATLTFDNNGGNNPQVTTGSGTLTVTGDIIAGGQNVSSGSTRIDGKLNLAGATTTITVNPVEWNGAVLNPLLPNLTINAPVEGGNIIKAGTGVLRLSTNNAFTGTFDLQAGGVLLGSNNAFSSAVVTIGDGTFLSSSADNRVVANDFILAGSLALRDAFNLTLSGAGSLAAGMHNINVELAAKSLSLTGVLTGAGAGITKTGNGILVLSNNSNAYTGATVVSDGILNYGGVDAIPTGSALTVLEGTLVDITLGGSAVTVGSIASDNAMQGGVIVTTANSGTTVFTAGGDGTSTVFGGVLVATSGATLEFVKTGAGTLTLGGGNLYNGSTTVADGRLIAQAVGGNSPLGSSQALVMGGGMTSGILQLGNSTGALSHTFTSLSSQGTGTENAIVSGNAAMATLTLDLATTSTFAGNIGGAGMNEANLNLVKEGAGDLVINGTGTSLYNGSTTVNGGKLFFDTPGAFPATTTSLTVTDGSEFSLRGTTNMANQVFGFSGAGNKVTVGSSTGATLGFALDGGFNSQINLLTGQTMTVNGTLTTAVYVNSAPISLQDYILINGADANSLHAGGGVFDLNPVIFNGGSFTYALRNETLGGTVDQWILTPTAVPSAPESWWVGDLTGLGQGVWSATLTSGTGFPSNWATAADGVTDALVPPDGSSNVHFSAMGATNLDTTLGADLTIKSLTFHTGNAATTIGSSNGINTLTLGNGMDTPFLTIETDAADVGISAIVNLPQDQSWTIEDTARILTLSGGLTGMSRTLTVNATATNAGTLLFTGSAATMTGTLAINAGNLVFEDTGSLNSALDVVLGTATRAATLRVGGATVASGVVIGGLSDVALAGSRVIGGNAAMSTLTIGATSGTATFAGALGGGGMDENQFNLVKAGAGTQILNGAATYAGSTTVTDGTLQLGAASNFAPTGALSVIANAGVTAILDFNGKNFTTTGTTTLGGGTLGSAQIIGAGSALTLGGDIVFDATNDPGAAVISTNIITTGANRVITVGESVNAPTDLTFNGTITSTSNNSLTLAGPGNATLNGNVTILSGAGTTKDVNFNGTGVWTINAKIEITDTIAVNSGVVNATAGESLDASNDVVIDGTGTPGSAIVNISSSTQVHTGDDIFIRNGGLINVLTNGGIGTGTDQLVVGDSNSTTAGSAGVLNLEMANISVGSNGLFVGNSTQIGHITGTGIITTSGSKDIRNGSIGAGITLAGNGAIVRQGLGTLMFFGARDAASTGDTLIREGILVLDYSLNNASKIGDVLQLGFTAASSNPVLIINGSSSAATTDTMLSTTILPSHTTVSINNGTGQTATLNLQAITRSVPGGTIAFEYSSADAKATTTNAAGTLGWATLVTGAGSERFAAIDGSGNIVEATLTTQSDTSLWMAGQNIINDAAISGVINCVEIDSLTFAASVASTLNIDSAGHLRIGSGGIIVDASVGAFDTRITGGRLYGAASGVSGEVIVHQNNTLGLVTIASDIVNSRGITKTGAGTLILSGGNTFSLAGSEVNVSEGILRLVGGNAIGDNTAVRIRTGTTLDLAGSTEVVGSLTDESNGTLALGAGALTVNQAFNADYRGVFTGTAASMLTLNAISGTTTFNLNVTGATTTGFTGAVVINAGLLQLSSGGRLANATAFTINKGGTLLLDNNSASRTDVRILDTATITLNSADGGFNGATQTRPRGLGLRTDQDSTNSETVGVITANSGASYVTMEATTANDDPDLRTVNLVRMGNATLNIRGTNLGTTGTQRTQFEISNGTNETAFIAALFGGAGSAGSKNISIVPWAIGQTFTGGLADTHMGNSLVTYVAGSGIRPLDFATEYSTFSSVGGVTDNVRESLTADLPILISPTVNALVIHKDSTSAGTIQVTGSGAGSMLTSSSGVLLFTQNTGAAASSQHSVILGGFDDGVQVGGNEYVIHVVNPSAVTTTATLTATIASPLNTTAASVTKSGRGTLEFTAVNTYQGGTTINEGAILVHDTGNLGSGGVTLAGGTLIMASDFAGALDVPTLSVLSGGGTVQVDAPAVSATDLAISGTGPLIKTGSGTLQLTGTTASTYSGDFNVRAGTLELNKSAGTDAIGGGTLFIGFSTVQNETGTVRLLADNQINDATHVSLRTATTGAVGILDLNDHAETVGSLTMGTVSSSGVLVRTGAAGVLTVTGDITLNNDRQTNDAGTNARNVVITGTGSASTAAPNTGTLDLGGATRTITVLYTGTAAPIGNQDATIETVITNGGIIKEGDRTLVVSAANTYAGGTTVNAGELNVRSTGTLGSGAVTVGKAFGSLTDAAVLSGDGTIAGAVTIGDDICDVGILAVGSLTSTTTQVVNYGTGANGTLTLTADNTALTVASGSQVQLELGSPTNDMTPAVTYINGMYEFNGGTYATAADLFGSMADNGGALGADGAEALAIWNVAPTISTNHDFLNLTGTDSSLSIGTRASGAFGDGSIVVSSSGFSGASQGQVFNLIDWQAVTGIGGTFSTGPSAFYDAGSDVSAGDLDLLGLSAGLAWDVSAFSQYGIIVVVPEPSRALLLMLGLFGFMLRRRRRA